MAGRLPRRAGGWCGAAATGDRLAGVSGQVKCLYALVVHELAADGVNPFGWEAVSCKVP